MRQQEENSTHLCHKFYQDRGLQKRIFIATEGGRYYHYDHVRMLEETKKGVPGMLQWSADRANFGCCPKVVLPLLRGSQQSHLLDKLETMPLRKTPIPMTCTDQWFLDEIALLKLVRVFYTNLGINMLWMEAQYAICFPHKLAVMNHQEPEQVKNGCAYMKKTCRCHRHC